MAHKDLNRKFTTSAIGITTCIFLVCSFMVNTVSFLGVTKLIYLGIGFAIIASTLGFFGLSKNRHCIACSIASGIGLVVALAAMAITVFDIQETLSL